MSYKQDEDLKEVMNKGEDIKSDDLVEGVSEENIYDTPTEDINPSEELVSDDTTIEEDNKKGKKKYLLLLLLLLLFTITAISLVVYKNKGNIGLDNPFSIGLDSNLSDGNGGKSKEEIQAELNKKVEEGMMNVSMNTNIVLKNGKSKANLKITNKENNRYMQFVEIYTKEDNKLIHKTGGIPVGKSLNEAKLDEELKKGTYECVAFFNGVDETTNSIVGKVGVNITINVLN